MCCTQTVVLSKAVASPCALPMERVMDSSHFPHKIHDLERDRLGKEDEHFRSSPAGKKNNPGTQRLTMTHLTFAGHSNF